jgi:AcrR family transcriptional regulator
MFPQQPPKISSTRDRIVVAAIACFERDGVEATTMHDIASQAGLSRKSLYRHFADRPTLLLTILTQRVLALIDILQV